MPGTLSGRSAALLALCMCGAAGVAGQIRMGGSAPGGVVRIFNTDLAVLEMQEPRKDLPCSATPVKALLGFDLKFHSGYEVSVPLRDLAGSENLLTILFRVTPEVRPDEQVYFVQRVRVPSIEEDARGDAFLQGSFDLGEGNYHVDWLMRDRSERVCSAYWDAEATLAARDRQMGLRIAAGEIRASENEQFREEPPVERAASEPPLNVKVLVNFAPQNAHASTLQPIDTSALVSILRTISRDPRIGKFSITAFNLQERRVVFRQADADRIDFPGLGEAIGSLNLGTVSVKLLGQKHGETEFLADLIKKEAGAEPRPDALVFAGPKAMLDQNVQPETLKEIGDLDYPVFYMNYALNPQAAPWRDAISHAVRFFKGYEFTISRPRDLWFAVTEMVSRIVKLKHGRPNAASSSE
ncbi:MAG: acetyltransferase [Acidobacteria bacterium]|nr:acetyltransferase [Acidobacteriota bacterium]